MNKETTYKIPNNLEFDRHSDIEAFALKGFQEVVFSVRDLERSIEFYCDVSGWECAFRSKVSDDLLQFWKLPEDCNAEEALLINPRDAQGFLRLIAFENIAQQHIRSNSQSWDTGGIYDIDVRVKDLEETYSKFRNAGWSGFNDPLEYHFAEFHVSEILLKGQEDIVFALIQRHAPPLKGFPNMKRMSHIFNSSQIVKDMEASKDFYINKLGFKIYKEIELSGSSDKENLFGMPQNFYRSIERKICILSPDGANSGSVELVQLKGAEGRDHAKYAHPPNLGILLLRFPVFRIEKLVGHLRDKGVNIVNNLQTINIAPYGNVKTVSIQSPDGAMLEFIELD